MYANQGEGDSPDGNIVAPTQQRPTDVFREPFT
jgi:hypothetical protein